MPAHGRAGAKATSSLAAHFAKRNTKFGGGGNPSSRTLRVHYGAGARAGPEGETPHTIASSELRGKSFPYGVNKNSCFLLAP